ncbi:hypothetical protein BZA77DRAFT_306921 [Pyronema omphalodes]|nr:hypothetical protein BZA77DRAFT_306921 [Pyronema omphalodes]
MMFLSESEQSLLHRLRDAPKDHRYRYTNEARTALLQELFNSLACHRRDYMSFFFPNGVPTENTPEAWNLSSAQGASEGAEYSAGARGKPCGHIFKTGEATYRCKTCSLDDTCVLCSKCYDSSDHEGHTVYVSVSPGNSGCCDCGDAEAWRIPVKCAIHTPMPGDTEMHLDDEINPPQLPPDLVQSIRSTISRTLDYLCDIISCAPEQLRLEKSEAAIRKDEELSRLTSRYYGEETEDPDMEYALILWNDEKHTVSEVQEQVSRACKESREFGKMKAHETNSMGRSVVCYSQDIKRLLDISRRIEHIKVTVTIRSARDTFREQMCGTIIEWLEDISGCSVGGDHNIIRTTVCEELLGIWRRGSKASNTEIGKNGIDDHSWIEETDFGKFSSALLNPAQIARLVDSDEDEPMDGMDMDGMDGIDDAQLEMDIDEYNDDDDDDDLHENEHGHEHIHEHEDEGTDDDEDDVEMVGSGTADSENGDPPQDAPIVPTPTQIISYVDELTPPRPVGFDGAQEQVQEAGDDENGAPRIPITPNLPRTVGSKGSAPSYWTEKPWESKPFRLPPHEDLKKRVRLDWLIMFDLRLWKRARIHLRDLYITTVVVIPQFKRILGLRFAGLYPTIAELYLVADREPDHSIINMSLQMLTTPSITAEVVKRGNFLTTLMAIIYTFLTTRQVGHPDKVNPSATLAFDGGPLTNPLTNRRMYHFFHDMRYILGADYVKERLRVETRYALQFLDLVCLHQGICPNTRAVTEHVEYEAEAWISASLVTREINKLSKQFAEAFYGDDQNVHEGLRRAIKLAARYTTVNSMGWQRERFPQSEMKAATEFQDIGGFEFDTDRWNKQNFYKIVRFSVDKDPISFHHALHYTLSWLIEAGKSMSNEQLRELLLLKSADFLPHVPANDAKYYEPEDLAIAMFDFPLRVCVWLAQMKTGMWVRNGFSLRHQMQTYRSISQRDLTHHRDIFLLQTALVTVNPSRMLANMVHRFNLKPWMEGNYTAPGGYDDAQVLDLVEDFLHLLIVVLSDRLPLIPVESERNLQSLKIRRELIHILCFKPLPFSDLCRHIPERLQDNDKFNDILSEIATYREPDGLADVGTFTLKDEYLDEVDPYIVQFTKNQREDMENNCRARIAKKTGIPEADVVLEPRLRPIESGVFQNLAAFTKTALFAQIIYYSLAYALQFKTFNPSISETRVDIFLQLCLHLIQLAVLEDNSLEDGESTDSFVLHALEKQASGNSDLAIADGHRTIATVLYRLASIEDFKSCWVKINYILRSFKQKRPAAFSAIAALATGMGEKFEVDEKSSQEAEAQRKKQLAKERQAKIMEQFKQQQQTFMDTAGLDFEDDDYSDTEDNSSMPHEEKQHWKFPSGTCILCQEEMNESRLYGSLAYVTESNILRQTDPMDADYVLEVVKTPDCLDRSAQDIRPFGVAQMNRKFQKKLVADGSEILVERQGLGRGFPADKVKRGPVVTGCSHLMHFSCFEHYYDSTRRRQPYQIARNHPENLDRKEFVCPLCKALGNAFLPIIWKPKEETPVGGVLQPEESFSEWLAGLGPLLGRTEKMIDSEAGSAQKYQTMFQQYGLNEMVASIADKLREQTQLQLATKVAENRPDLRAHVDSPLIAPHPPSASTVSMGAIPTSRPTNSLEELHRTYHRLRDTFRDNKICTHYASLSTPWPELNYCDSIVRSLGFSISAVEIAQRGIASETGYTLLDKISPQVISHLRILSETVSSYFAIGVLKGRNDGTLRQFREMENAQLRRMFIGHPRMFTDTERADISLEFDPFLASDPFLFLADSSVCAVPSFSWHIQHFIRLCYIAELVKAILAFGRDCELPEILSHWERSESLAEIEGHIGYTESQISAMQKFIRQITIWSPSTLKGIDHFSSFALAIFRHLIGTYATPFLRKTVILLYARFGCVFPFSGFAEPDEPEASRLCKILGLPTVDEVFTTVLAENEEGIFLQQTIQGWLKHLAQKSNQLSVSHPAIFELVGLPKNFDTLVEESMKRKCPSTGGEVTDPAVCLFCGEIMCSQALCCTFEPSEPAEDETHHLGGCNKHMMKCGKNIGLFINIRKCALLHLHNRNGTWAEAPYLDVHGETDLGFRRTRQLFLNQRRYDALIRSVWLNHGIPSVISRKLEAEINTGGWDSL